MYDMLDEGTHENYYHVDWFGLYGMRALSSAMEYDGFFVLLWKILFGSSYFHFLMNILKS